MSFEAMEVLADAEITHKRMSARQRKSSKEERKRRQQQYRPRWRQKPTVEVRERKWRQSVMPTLRESGRMWRGESGRKGGSGGPTMRTGRTRELGRWADGASAQQGGDEKKEVRGGGKKSTEKREHGWHQEEVKRGNKES